MAKSRRNIVLTDAQAKVWADIVGVKSVFQKEKKKKEYSIMEPTPIEKYMENCLFWINEYKAGRATKEKYISALHSLAHHCKVLLDEIYK